MKLPKMKYGDGIVKQTQVRFGGYNHSLYARDGEIYDMKNITADAYPLIMPRKGREVCSVYNKDEEMKVYNDYTYRFYDKTKLIIDTRIQIKDIISLQDKIRIDCDGTYQSNSGEYIVKGIDNTLNSLTVERYFDKHDGGRLPSEAIRQVGKLTVTLLQKSIGDPIDVTETKTDYRENDESGETVVYTINENNHTKKVTAVEAAGIWKVTESLIKKKFVYDDEPSNVYRYCSVSYKETMSETCINIRYLNENSKLVLKDNDGKETTVHIKSRGSKYEKYYVLYEDDKLEMNCSISVYPCREIIESERNIISVTYQNGSVINKEKDSRFEGDTRIYTEIMGKYVYETTTTTKLTTYNLESIDRFYEIESIGAGSKFYYLTKTKGDEDTKGAGQFIYDGIYAGKLTRGDKIFAETGAYIFIIPDMAYFNTNTGELKTDRVYSRRQNFNASTGYKIEYTNDTLNVGAHHELFENFKVEEVVTVRFNDTEGGVYSFSGQIKSLSESTGKITFNAEIFKTLSLFLPKIAKVELSYNVPALRSVCAVNNRIWGCDDKNIYCSAFGKPLQWAYFEASAAGNIADNSWSIQPFDNAGEFTACAIVNDYPTFFKERKVYRVYGSNPSEFTLQSYDVPGVMKGSEKSLQVINEVLYYLSPEGVIRYSGGIADNISEEFNEEITDGAAGTDGTKYYLSAKTKDGYKLFVYDTKKNIWCIEDNIQALNFCFYERRLFMLDSGKRLLSLNPGKLPYPISFDKKEETPESFIEFADYYCSSPDKKAVSKIYFRLTIEDGGEAEILINYDSEIVEAESKSTIWQTTPMQEQPNEEGLRSKSAELSVATAEGERVWRSVKTLSSDKKRSYTIPVIPKRCDHFRVKVRGKGFILYSMSYEYYVGTGL